MHWTPVQSVFEVTSGYLLVMPISKDTIYIATSDYTDFDSDFILNNLVRR